MSATRNSNLGLSSMRARRRRLFFIRLYIIFFLLLVVVLTLAILSSHKKVRVETVIVSGNAVVSSEEILNIFRRDMTGRYFYLFSKSNSLIFPRLKIKEDILNEIKTVKDLDISWDDWRQVSIKIAERKPHSVWCGEKAVIKSDCFFVDKEGLIFSEAPDFSGSVFIKDYGNVSTSTPLGQYFLPRDLYSQIFAFINILDGEGLRVVSVSYDGFDFRFALETGPEIIFNTKSDLKTTFSNLFSAIESGNIDLIKDAGNISYVDLRFGNKLVVGKKNKK